MLQVYHENILLQFTVYYSTCTRRVLVVLVVPVPARVERAERVVPVLHEHILH